MNDIEILEKQLSENLDDLLVENGLEPKRKVHFSCPGNGTFGMVVCIKEPARVNFKIELYPNETEEPHFKVVYQNTTCRFKISDCSPMKAEAKKGIAVPIKKIMKEIKTTWKNNKEQLIQEWYKTRPTDQNHGHQKIR